MEINMQSEFRNTDAAAAYLGIKKNTLEIWRVQGRGPQFVKIGRRVFYRLQDLDRFIEDAIRQSTSV